ncbi:U3 snoRNP protein [Cavenderia fasciculata]|uniref:U3 snoRNP protein n=1 Tax=Cavenderia fasciculata TaxID=261658 RepID=F4PJS5_CACFS|nr:U3 snoRNP protein [Cavenderia fasciculata]EGG23849.1 U3 snoRNP protein [Cavenderia fasciculata]|eukprot:XP_004361700.1 U3 snoRNP protein [Cavenderia fasciculata]
MKVKRNKNNKKIIAYYHHNFSFREPFSVLVDPFFIFKCLEFNVDFDKAIRNTLGEKTRLYTTTCALEEARIQGEDYQNVLNLARTISHFRCNHKDHEFIDRDFPTYSCFEDMVTKNPSRFYLCVQNNDARFDLRTKPGIPLMFILSNFVILENPSKVSYQTSSQTQKDLTKITDYERALVRKEVLEQRLKIKLERIRSKGKDPELELLPTAAETAIELERKAKEERERKMKEEDLLREQMEAAENSYLKTNKKKKKKLILSTSTPKPKENGDDDNEENITTVDKKEDEKESTKISTTSTNTKPTTISSKVGINDNRKQDLGKSKLLSVKKKNNKEVMVPEKKEIKINWR